MALARLPPFGVGRLRGTVFSDLFYLGGQLLAESKIINNSPFSKTLQNLKIRPGASKVIGLGRSGELSLHQFSLYFTTPRKLIFCNMDNAKCLFWRIKASHFSIKKPSKHHVFSRHLPAHPFFKFYVDFMLTL